MEQISFVASSILESGETIKTHVEALNDFELNVENQQAAMQSIGHTTKIREKQIELEKIKTDNLKRAVEAEINHFKSIYPSQKRILEAQQQQLNDEYVQLENERNKLSFKESELNQQLKEIQAFFNQANNELENISDISFFEPEENGNIVLEAELSVNNTIEDIEKVMKEIGYTQSNITKLETMIINISMQRVNLIEQIQKNKAAMIHGTSNTDIKIKNLNNEILSIKEHMIKGEIEKKKFETQKNIISNSIENKEKQLMQIENVLNEVERSVNDLRYKKNSIQNQINDTIGDTKTMKKHVRDKLDIYNSNNLEKAKLIEDILLDQKKTKHENRMLEIKINSMKQKSTDIQNKLIQSVVKLKEYAKDAERLEYMNADLVILDNKFKETEMQNKLTTDKLVDDLKLLYKEIKLKKNSVLKLESYKVPKKDPGPIVYKSKKSQIKKDYESYDNQIKCLKRECYKLEGYIEEMKEAQTQIKESIKDELLNIQDNYQKSINCKRETELCKFNNQSIKKAQFDSLQKRFNFLKDENEKKRAKILNKRVLIDNIMKEYNFSYSPDNICVVPDHHFKQETEIKKELGLCYKCGSYKSVKKIVDHLQKLNSQVTVMKDSLSLNKNNEKQNITLLTKWSITLDQINNIVSGLPRNTWLFLNNYNYE